MAGLPAAGPLKPSTNPTPTNNQPHNIMAIKLIANYCKRLGLPGYSSHQFSVSVETELVTTDDVAAESERLYQLPPIHRGRADAPHRLRPARRLRHGPTCRIRPRTPTTRQRHPSGQLAARSRVEMLRQAEGSDPETCRRTPTRQSRRRSPRHRTLRQRRAHAQQGRSLRTHRRTARHPRRLKPSGQPWRSNRRNGSAYSGSRSRKDAA